MTTNTIRTEEEKNTIATTSTKAETLASIVTTVKRDCIQAAKAYLEETKVPHGGE